MRITLLLVTAILAFLAKCAVTIGQLESRLQTGDNKAKPGKQAAWDRCVVYGRLYDRLRANWIAAERTDLAESVTQLKTDVDALATETAE